MCNSRSVLSTTDVELRQTSDDVMMMSWKPVDYSENITYEAQVRMVSTQHQDFQQVKCVCVHVCGHLLLVNYSRIVSCILSV